MKYYKSSLHDARVRTDAKTNEAYIKRDGQEIQADTTSKVVADAIIEKNEITADEYNS